MPTIVQRVSNAGAQGTRWRATPNAPQSKDQTFKISKKEKKETSPEWLIFTAVKWISFLALQTEDTTETAALLLGAWDHEIRTAHTGPEALQVASDFDPEVILLDIGLPDIDGYEVARRLRQDPRFKDTLIIAMSGYGRDTDRQLSREAGFDEHLVKPVDLERLNRVLREKVRVKRAFK